MLFYLIALDKYLNFKYRYSFMETLYDLKIRSNCDITKYCLLTSEYDDNHHASIKWVSVRKITEIGLVEWTLQRS